jgi:hypothetical protein
VTARRARALATALACLASACAPRLGPDSFGNAIAPMEVPAEYATWYAELAACIDATPVRPFEAIHWYRSRSERTLTDPRTGEVLAGFWTQRRSAIIVGAAYASDPAVVKHELLHYLLGAGDHRHPAFRAANGCGVAPVPVTAAVSAAAARPSVPRASAP